MRILHVLDHSIPIQSGYSSRTVKIIESQQQLGFDTFQITGIKQGSTEHLHEVVDGLGFYRTPAPKGFVAHWPILKHWFGIRALRKRFEACIKTIQPDIIHVHSPVLNALAVKKVARLASIPMVYEVRAFWEDAAVDHGTHQEKSLRYRLSHWLESRVMKRAHHVTTICEGLEADILARGLPKDKITVVPNAIDAHYFAHQKPDWAQRERYETLWQLKGKFVLGYIGSMYAYEGLDLLLEACHRLQDRFPHLRVLLVGGGPEEKKIQQKIQDLRLGKRVIFAGKKPHDEVATLYSLCDACVFPRRRMRLTETVTPLKPLEAMAREVLVLASDVGGHKELIRHEKTGLLFEADSVESLMHTIVQCMQESKPLEIIYAAKNYVLEHRNWAKTSQQYKRIYEKLLSA